MATFSALASAFALWFRASGRRRPERIDGRDLVLVTLAKHRASRMIAKDRVTSTVRARRLRDRRRRRSEHLPGPKDNKGPSDPRAKNLRARENRGETYGGVDVEGNSKQDLMPRQPSMAVRPVRPSGCAGRFRCLIRGARRSCGDPAPGRGSRTSEGDAPQRARAHPRAQQ